jgi:hypothetical protein
MDRYFGSHDPVANAVDPGRVRRRPASILISIAAVVLFFSLLPVASGGNLYTYVWNPSNSLLNPSTITFSFNAPSILPYGAIIPASSLISLSMSGTIASLGCNITAVYILPPSPFANTTWTVGETLTSCSNPSANTTDDQAGFAPFTSNGTYTNGSTGTLTISQTPYYYADLAFGGGFQTTLTLVNYSPQTVTCTTTFYADNGSALSVPFAQGTISTRTDILFAGGAVHDQTTAGLGGTATEGWAQSSCNGPVEASLLYRYYVNGVAASEASVNAEPAATTEFATFAQTATAVAYANPSATQSASITLTAYNASGSKLGFQTSTLGPLQHTAANLGPLFALSSFTGSVKITSSIPIISLSLNAEAFPVISSLPPGDLPSGTAIVP